ncbi:UDP-glucose 4-epimerase GalE [Planococcus beigongshangi]|uniref:UDP-glucose 4-epimerase GalE n=1 Tax=Planococcus beigongshangi TaxID=2782536 RepID=UPI00193C6755|nr:UDP-glucose 4-epimerase GalE [Planococcus beigongshangi]
MILVTGGAGYIGSHAAVELLENGYEIVILDSLANSSYESILRIKELTGRNFEFYEVDLLETEKVENLFRMHNIKAVMHFAGLKSVGESVSFPLDYYGNNIAGTLNLCKIMSRFNVRELVFSSSATVYRTIGNQALEESSSLGANNPYGRTKLVIEEMLHDLYRSDPFWKIVILRYFNPIGAHESGKIGEDPAGIPNNLMPYITQVAIGRRPVLQVFGEDYDTPDGTCIRDYIHISDLVKGHLKALEYLTGPPGIETFNLGTGKGYSVLDLVKEFSRASGIEIPYQVTDRREGDVPICYASAEKARNRLLWEAEKDLFEMCQDAWRWQAMNPYGYGVIKT